MKRRMITTKTCLLMGVCGAVLQLVGGLLILLRLNAASYLHIAAMSLYGGMLLFLAVGEKGRQNRSTRTRMLGLFFLLLLALLPVPVGPLCYGLCLVLFAVFRGSPGDVPLLVVMGVAELGFTVIQTLAETGFTGGVSPTLLVGLGLIVVACTRGAALVRLFLRENKKTPLEPN